MDFFKQASNALGISKKPVPPPLKHSPEIFTLTSLISLSIVASYVGIAYVLSQRALIKSAPAKLKLIFGWHVFDALVHFSLEGSYLYNCFFTYTTTPSVLDLPMTAPGVHFLGEPARLYGSFYGTAPTAKLWQEYAKADRRWGGSDLTVISLELLTVFVMGPLAVYVCYLLWNRQAPKAYFWMTIVATSELYGGFMTFAPEWLSGSPNLDGSNFMYMWVYLVFMNMLWVFIPLFILYEAYTAFSASIIPATTLLLEKKKK